MRIFLRILFQLEFRTLV